MRDTPKSRLNNIECTLAREAYFTFIANHRGHGDDGYWPPKSHYEGAKQ